MIGHNIWQRRAITFVAAGAGGALFYYLNIPLPLLLGPLAVCLVASLAGLRPTDMGAFSHYMRTFLGVAVGASITPDVVAKLPAMAASLAFIPLFIIVIGVVGYPLFRFGFRMNHPTAYYAAMPGGLQDMLVFGQEAGGDVRALSLIHATRVLVIVVFAPVIISWYWSADLTLPPGQPVWSIPLSEILIMAVAGGIGWKIAAKVGLFGASILGPMILTAILSLAGVIHHRPPAEIIWAAQLFIGVSIGAHYAGITSRELKMDIGAGLLYSVLLAGVSLIFFEIISQSGIAPPLDALLAFLPGGQAEMVVIAIIAGADLSYVVSHHLVRLVLVILLAPVVAMLMRRISHRRHLRKS